MVNCTVCRTANHCGKSGHSAKFCYAKGGKEKGRNGDSKGWNDSKDWTVGKGWSVGTHQAKVGSNKDQQE